MLEVDGLTVELGDRRVVDAVDFRLARGERRGLIGASGSGKSLTGLSLLGLLPAGAAVSGSVRFEGTELLGLPESRLARLRGSSMAMVFQDSLSALNPLVRVERQVAEPLRRHGGLSRSEARAAVIGLLERVRFADPERVARCRPPELSGGQRQRVALAMALACRPAVLIADEPTTALDVTVQAEVLGLLTDIVAEEDGPALLFVSHDLPVVARTCENAMVMDGGSIVENAAVTELIHAPQHPRTAELVSSALEWEATGGGPVRASDSEVLS
ncbi:ABC transporter ATP-binding protein [Parasphingorhabdus pacifica]